ncbi:RNA polymerase sigma factor RpoD [Candidatus Entotheonellaceae bacterium PAL068K]
MKTRQAEPTAAWLDTLPEVSADDRVQEGNLSGVDRQIRGFGNLSDGTEEFMAETDPEVNSLLMQYFGDVRQYALLSRAEEKAVWDRIEHWKKRVRRGLYTSPVLLPTLTRLWQDIQRGERQLHHLVGTTPDSAPGQEEQHVERALGRLQQLARRRQQLDALRQPAPATPQARRARRRARVRAWRQWLATCERLGLRPKAHEEVGLALEAAHQSCPDNPALRVAVSAWRHARSELDQAKAAMLRANLRLVIYVAKRYCNHGVPFLDLIQEGNIGLMRALDKFEPSRGVKFVTYAHWWVRQAVGRGVIEQRHTVRLPSHIVERKNKMSQAQEQLWHLHRREPTPQELSQRLGWTAYEVETVQRAKQAVMPLNEPLTEDGRRLDEAIEDDQTPQPDVLAAHRELQQRVAACLGDLTEREAHILRLRFGMETDHPHSLREIGDLYGLSRERIRQLESLALKKLRCSAYTSVLAECVEMA